MMERKKFRYEPYPNILLTNYHQERLENGLSFYYYQDTELPLNSAGIYLVVKVGSLYEDQNESGFSHFLEHLLVRAGIDQAQVNSFRNISGSHDEHETKFDHTIFGFLAQSQPEISDAIKLLGTMSTKVSLRKEHLDAERDIIILEDMGSLENSNKRNGLIVESQICNKDIKELCTAGHFQEMLLGSSISEDQINSFYKKWYHLSNMGLIVVGNCNLKCVLQVFALGGLAQSCEEDYYSHQYACTLGDACGLSGAGFPIMGHGKVFFSHEIQRYVRKFYVEFFAPDVEVALQMVYLLFESNNMPLERSHGSISECLAAHLSSQSANSSHTVLEEMYGKSYLYKPLKLDDIEAMDVSKACSYFNQCFAEPSEFTTVIVGNLELEKVENQVKKYLGSIPHGRCDIAFPNDPRKLNMVDVEFSPSSRRLELYQDTTWIEAFICLPSMLGTHTLDEDKFLLCFLMYMMRERLYRRLRAELGKVYKVWVCMNYEDDWFSPTGSAFVMASFSFLEKNWDLVEEALQVLEQFRLQGPLEEEIDIAVQRMKNVPNSSSSLASELSFAYLSASYKGNIQDTFKERQATQRRVANYKKESWNCVISRLFPFEFTNNNVAFLLSRDPPIGGSSSGGSSSSGNSSGSSSGSGSDGSGGGSSSSGSSSGSGSDGSGGGSDNRSTESE